MSSCLRYYVISELDSIANIEYKKHLKKPHNINFLRVYIAMKTLLQKTAINFLFVFFMTNLLSGQSISDKDNVYIVVDFEEVNESVSYLSKSKNMKNSTFEFSILKNNKDRIVFDCLDEFRVLKLNEKDLKKLNTFQISHIADMDIITFLKGLTEKKFFVLEKLDNNKYKLYSVQTHSYIEREQY